MVPQQLRRLEHDEAQCSSARLGEPELDDYAVG